MTRWSLYEYSIVFFDATTGREIMKSSDIYHNEDRTVLTQPPLWVFIKNFETHQERIENLNQNKRFDLKPSGFFFFGGGGGGVVGGSSFLQEFDPLPTQMIPPLYYFEISFFGWLTLKFF